MLARSLLLLTLTPALAAAPLAKPPKLDIRLRAAPRVGKIPATFLFTAELRGVTDSEAFHCLTLEWSWDGEDTTTREQDCPAFEPGRTKVERVLSESHTYASAGVRSVRLAVKKNGKVLGVAKVQVHAVDPRIEFRQTEIVRDY